jgi:hypothetical protein
MASKESTSPRAARGDRKRGSLGLSVLAVAALAVPALSTFAPSSSAAPPLPARGGPVKISPDSHRLAAAVATSNSLRLT